MEPTCASSKAFKVVENLWSSERGKMNLSVLEAACLSSTLLLIFFEMMSLVISALLELSLLRVITTWYPTLNLSVMNYLLPTIINLPLDIMAIRFDRCSASSRWWVVKIMQRF